MRKAKQKDINKLVESFPKSTTLEYRFKKIREDNPSFKITGEQEKKATLSLLRKRGFKL